MKDGSRAREPRSGRAGGDEAPETRRGLSTLPLASHEAWIGLLVVGTAVAASEEWGAPGAVLAAAGVAGVGLAWADEAPWAVTLASLCTAGAASVHFAVTAPHLREWWGYGVAFLALAWAQLLWASVAPRRVERPPLRIGLAGNLLVAALWAVTRAVGLPLGPAPGTREAVGGADLVATALELIAAAACAWTLVGCPRRVVARARWWLALAAGGATAYGLVAAAGGH